MAYLAGADDANAHLDQTKLSFADDVDAEPEAINADAIIRAALADLTDEVDTWGGANTPALVRTIAGMLMASMRYSKRYSEESNNPNGYAEAMWRRAMDLLMDIRSGSLELHDVETVSGIAWSRENFWPNDLTTDRRGIPIRAFSTEMEF